MSCRKEESASAALIEDDVATLSEIAFTKTGSHMFTASACYRMIERLSTDETTSENGPPASPTLCKSASVAIKSKIDPNHN